MIRRRRERRPSLDEILAPHVAVAADVPRDERVTSSRSPAKHVRLEMHGDFTADELVAFACRLLRTALDLRPSRRAAVARAVALLCSRSTDALEGLAGCAPAGNAPVLSSTA